MNPADAATAAAVQAMVNAGVMVNQEVIYEDDEADASIPDIQKITKKNNVLPLWGNAETMNLNALVLSNVVQSTYFKNYLSEATGFQQMTEELYYNVTHLEPWERGTRKTQGMTGMCGGVRGVGAGGVVSTAYCILYKLFTMRLTRKQLVGLINNTTSPFSRGIGFMYIRYTSPPSDLWAWMEPYLDDEEEIDPRSGGGDKMTVGQMVKTMITKLDWYGTLFPRIPVPIQKEIEQKFRDRAAEEDESRKQKREERTREKEQKAMFEGDGPSISRDDRKRSRSRDRGGRHRDDEPSGHRDKRSRHDWDSDSRRDRDYDSRKDRDYDSRRDRDRRDRDYDFRKDRDYDSRKDRDYDSRKDREKDSRKNRDHGSRKDRDNDSRKERDGSRSDRPDRRDRERDSHHDHDSHHDRDRESHLDRDRDSRREIKRHPRELHRCGHHLKHHHCRKHRHDCPKAPKRKSNDSSQRKED